MPLPNQLPKKQFQGVDPEFQIWLNELTDTVNTHSGYNGTNQVASDIDLGGKRVMNVAPPVSPTDAITSAVAEGKYSAAALRPKLQTGGSAQLSTYRMLNSPTQREQTSTYLNDLVSTPPNSNTINPIITSSGGSTEITIPASFLQMGDGTKLFLPSRTDTISNPVSISITSFTIAGGVATVVLSSAPSPAFSDSTVVYISGTGEIDGTYQVASIVNPTTFTILVSGGISGTGGTLSTGGTYYYYLMKRSSKVLFQQLPNDSDTPFNRLTFSSMDGFQLLAVIRVNSDGSISEESAGGGTPILSTANAGSRF